MAKLIDVFKAIVSKNWKTWESITDEEKEEFFFIINRFMSKKYPKESQLLNEKLINKISAMDTWFIFMQSQPYPKWFWSKSSEFISEEIKPEISEKEMILLSTHLELNVEDVELLIRYYPVLIKDELKYLKDVEKQSK